MKKSVYKWIISLFLCGLQFPTVYAQNLPDSLKKGELYIKQEEYLAAFDLFLRLTEQLETQKADTNILAYSYMHLANCYEYFDYDKNAVVYLQKAIALFRKTRNKEGIAYCLAYYGDILEDAGETSKAMQGYNQALRYFAELNNQSGIAMVYDNMASVYETLHEYQSATLYLDKASLIFDRLNDTLGKAKVLNNRGDVYRRWGKLPLSLHYYKEALSLAQQIKSNEEQRGNLKDISRTYAELGNYNEAYKSFDTFFEAHKKLKIENKIDEIAKLQVENMRVHKNLEIKSLEAEKKVVSLRFFIVAMALCLSIIILFLVYAAFRIKAQKDRQVAFIKQELLEAEVKTTRLEKQNLEKELDLKMKKLTNFTDKLIDRNELVDQLKTRLNDALEKEKVEKSSRIKMLAELSNATILTDDDWKRFKKRFENVHEGFFY